MAVGSQSGSVVVWDLDTCSAVHQHASAISEPVSVLAFDEDGMSLVWAGASQTLWHWDSNSPQPRQVSVQQHLLGGVLPHVS